MKPPEKIVLVLVTAPSTKAGRAIARAALENRLVACVNIIPRLESHYWWQGKIEFGNEVLLVLKTTIRKLAALERVVLANHPYETPEFVAVPIAKINKRYATWLVESIAKDHTANHAK